MKISRRKLLQLGFLGVFALLVGQVALSLRKGRRRISSVPLLALEPAMYDVLAAVADRLCPGDARLPSATAMGLAERVDAYLSKCHPADIRDFSRALSLVDSAWVRFFFEGQWGAFTLASPEEQVATLSAYRTSRLHFRRTIYRAIRNLCVSVYWSEPAFYAELGYAGPPQFGQGMGRSPSRPPVEKRLSELGAYNRFGVWVPDGLDVGAGRRAEENLEK